MTLLIDRPLVGPKTHAFVIGVGDYPYAKENEGVQENLRGVNNLPSAADSAKLMCDWLIENQEILTAPLATLEVLISDPQDTAGRYPWNRGPVDRATEVNVLERGEAWFNRVTAEPGDIAFFYCCGHGASHLQQPVLFLENLNQNAINVWKHIDLGSLANSLRKNQSISAAFLFSDTCGEYLPGFELGRAQDCRFYPDPNLFAVSRNQVSLLCAAAEGMLAYEGCSVEDETLKFGRFTQTLIKGLSGSSARWLQNRWGVIPHHLLMDLKSLRRVFFNHWDENLPFEPYQAVMPSELTPIVFPQQFELPIVVMTDPPERMAHFNFVISQQNDPTLPSLKCRDAGDPSAWFTTVPPSCNALYAIAVDGADYYPALFQPNAPLFDQRVIVR